MGVNDDCQPGHEADGEHLARLGRIVKLTFLQIGATANVMNTKDRVRQMLADNPTMLFAEIAASIGVSRQRVHQIAMALGYPPRNTRRCTENRSEYKCWHNMVSRCTDPANSSWPSYGGRGIRVCDRWLRSFDSFLGDMGRRPTSQHSIDRIDNDGHYEPRNCRWATRAEQMSNTRAAARSRAKPEPPSSIDLNRAVPVPSQHDATRARGRYPKLSVERRKEAQAMRNNGVSIRRLAKHFGVTPKTMAAWTRKP